MTDHPLTLRVAAAQASLDQWRNKRWRMGEADCVRMTASHLRRMGYPVRLPPKGSYRTARAALEQLEARGFSSLGQAMDAMGFERIAPASAIAGDVVEIAGDDSEDLSALVVALGNGRVVGWHPDAPGATVLQPISHMITAWRIEPKVSGR